VTPPAEHSTGLAGVLGGGGLFGIGYALGVIDGLRHRGVDLSGRPLLGTSAGSWAAAGTALGTTLEEFLAIDVPRFPNPRRGVLADAARTVFGERTSPLVSVVVSALPRLRRTVLHGTHTPLADLVAASSAVPGLLAPHRIDGVSYVDGGVRSVVSADLASPAATLVVVAPLAGAMFGPFGSVATRRMMREVRLWRDAHGGRTLIFSPREAGAALARRPDQLFRRDVALRAYDAAIAQVASSELSGVDVPE
jgi:NTE family protein